MAASPKEEKERFFDALHQLDHLSDDEVAPRIAQTPLPPIRPLPSNIVANGMELQQQPSAPSTHSAAVVPQRLSVSDLASKVEPPQKTMRRTPQSTTAKPLPPVLSSKPSMDKKRKRATSIPKSRQIFTGSTFYFIPNDDAAPPRKLRIQRAVQYGAVWKRVWSAGVTHVIVDGYIKMPDVLKHLRVKELPAGAVIVNDTWLTESIGYREMRDHEAKRFQVQGSVVTSVPQQAAETRQPTVMDAEQGIDQTSERSDEDLEEVQDATDSSYHEIQAVLGDSAGGPSDALDGIIREMKETQNLPLDLEDDDRIMPLSTGLESSDSDSNTSKRPSKLRQSGRIAAKNQFMCMEKHDGAESNTSPNARTIDVLQNMASYYDRIGDSWRTLAYRRCISALRRETRLIATKEDAAHIPNIGERLATKIEEIVTTNTLKRLESTASDPNDQLLQLFMGIYQVGYSSASRWIAQGHRTLEDLKLKADLTPNQRIGVEHYDDFLQRIPRTEVAQHAKIVCKALREVDPCLQHIVGGSYRRGDPDSGDIDMLITKEGASLANIRKLVLDAVVPKLTKQGFLRAALATGATSRSDSSSSKWHGASALPQPAGAPWRRIDFLFVPWHELGAALIYFTGNDIFNRSLRLLASKKGMRLNQRGLYADVMRGEKRRRVTEGRLLEGQSEERIFEILGVPWRPPGHRKC